MRDFFKHNLWLKIAALLLSLFMWVFVLIRSQTEVSMEVETQVKSQPPGFCIVETIPKAVSVVLKGNERVLKRLRPSEIKVQFSIKEARTGRIYVTLSEESVKAPPHIGVVSIRPQGLWVVLTRNVKMTLPIKPNIIGLPGEGYGVEKVEVFPDRASLECAPRELKELTTEPVDISGVTDTVLEGAPIREPEGALKLTPREVRIKVTVTRQK
jgi:YbbR domain-containing protein